MVRYSLPLAAVAVVWAIAALECMTLGTTYLMPDNVHVDYGIPLGFATHTQSTLVGPVNEWTLNMGSLALDLAFWLGGMLCILLLVVLFERGSRPRQAPQGA